MRAFLRTLPCEVFSKENSTRYFRRDNRSVKCLIVNLCITLHLKNDVQYVCVCLCVYVFFLKRNLKVFSVYKNSNCFLFDILNLMTNSDLISLIILYGLLILCSTYNVFAILYATEIIDLQSRLSNIINTFNILLVSLIYLLLNSILWYFRDS